MQEHISFGLASNLPHDTRAREYIDEIADEIRERVISELREVSCINLITDESDLSRRPTLNVLASYYSFNYEQVKIMLVIN